MFKIKGFITVLFLYTVTMLSPSAHAEVTTEDMKAALKSDLRHPYLYFTEEEKPAIIARIKNDPECGDIWEKLLAEGNRFMYMPIEEVPPPNKHPRFTGNWDHRNRTVQYAEAAQLLAFLYQMTGEEKYARKAAEFTEAVCDLDTWTDRAHQFTIIYSRIMPWNVPDDQVMFSYDIYAAHTAIEMSMVYDWLYPALTVRERDRIRGALLEKAVTKVRGNWDFPWWSWAYRCNWNTTCCTGAALSSLVLLNENPVLIDVIAEAYNRIWKTFDEIGPDGEWLEGVGYSYANHWWAAILGDPLKRLTGGKYNLMKHPRLAAHPVNFNVYTILPPDGAVNFGDSGDTIRKTGTTCVYNKLADETNSAETAWYRETMLGEGTDIFDIIWPRPKVKSAAPELKSMHFASIGVIIMRSSFTDPETVTIACKAGKSDDPHHGHLDEGNFILQWRGEAFVKDQGSGPYDEQYFDDVRWTYPEASSAGHNLVFVNGELQIPGKQRGKPWNDAVGGKVVDFRTSSGRDYVLMDPSHAYPQKELKGWRRHIILEKPVVTVILDEIQSARGAEVETRFFSAVRQTPRGKYMLLEGKQGTMALIPIPGQDFTFRSGELVNLPVKEDAELKTVPYIGAVLKTGKEKTVMATIILPVKDDTEAASISKTAKRSLDGSGNATVIFSKEGRQYRYTFKNSKDGLVLE